MDDLVNQIKAYSNWAIEAARADGYLLDYSQETIPMVDTLLGDLYESQRDSPLPYETAARIATAFGIYAGETFIRNLGRGEWRAVDGTLYVQVGDEQAIFFPATAYRRMTEGLENSIAASYMGSFNKFSPASVHYNIKALSQTQPLNPSEIQREKVFYLPAIRVFNTNYHNKTEKTLEYFAEQQWIPGAYASRVMPGQTLQEAVANDLRNDFSYIGPFELGSIRYYDQVPDNKGIIIDRYLVQVSLTGIFDANKATPLGMRTRLVRVSDNTSERDGA